LTEWQWESINGEAKNKDLPATEEHLVSIAIKSFKKTDGAKFIDEIAQGLSSYDWRTSSTPTLNDSERLHQSVFRGSSGYKEIRQQLLEHLSDQSGRIALVAKKTRKILRYE